MFSPPLRNGALVVQSRCTGTGYGLTSQTWTLRHATRAQPIPAGLTGIGRHESSPAMCLDVTAFRNVIGNHVQLWRCQPRFAWNQRFRLLSVAQATCEVGSSVSKICGLALPRP